MITLAGKTAERRNVGDVQSLLKGEREQKSDAQVACTQKDVI